MPGAKENALATIGAVAWSVQLAPQIWKSWTRKATSGLSVWMMFLWAVSGLWLGVYNIATDLSIPLKIQPQCFTALAIICCAQHLYYGRKLPRSIGFGVPLICMVVTGAFEVGFVYACRAGAPEVLFGVLAAIFVNGGCIPQYYEIYREHAVYGISYPFLFVDLMGGLFSFLSLLFRPSLDALAAVSYLGLAILELGIFIIAAILYFVNGNTPRGGEQQKHGARAQGIASVAKDAGKGAELAAGEDVEQDLEGTRAARSVKESTPRGA